MAASGVLLVNLGSPDSPEPPDVRRYLAEFLDDPRVIDLPVVLRRALLYGAILPFRPRQSGEAYEQIWWEEGSPLIVITEQQAEALRARVDVPVAVGMRYGDPSIRAGLRELLDQGVDRVLLVPLYPHYAMSSYETVVARTQEVLAELGAEVDLHVQPPFYDDPGYLDALADTVRPELDREPDLVLFSYHGIPERHVRKTDPSGCFCLEMDDCCAKPHPAHAFCYRHQVHATTWGVAERLGLSDDDWALSFQSRLGRTPWLRPYTDLLLEELPDRGVKDLVVLCPSFVADCLETLEEMGIRGRESFVEAGGETYTLIPCLNDADAWIEVLQGFVDAWVEAPPRQRVVAMPGA